MKIFHFFKFVFLPFFRLVPRVGGTNAFSRFLINKTLAPVRASTLGQSGQVQESTARMTKLRPNWWNGTKTARAKARDRARLFLLIEWEGKRSRKECGKCRRCRWVAKWNANRHTVSYIIMCNLCASWQINFTYGPVAFFLFFSWLFVYLFVFYFCAVFLKKRRQPTDPAGKSHARLLARTVSRKWSKPEKN